jgi:hypothetical protein
MMRRVGICLLLAFVWCGAAAQEAARPDLRPDALNRDPNNWQTVAPGLEHLRLWRGNYVEGQPAAGPWLINLLRVDTRRVRLEVRHALDEGVGLETVSAMAQRYGALAAVNGGFFAVSGNYRGDSVGVLFANGALLSEPWPGRTSVGFVPREGRTDVVFGALGWDNNLRVTKPAGDTPRPLRPDELAVTLDGLNRERKANELILYTHDFHRTTLTDQTGYEAVLCKDKIASAGAGGSNLIPPRCAVLSASGTRAVWAAKLLRRGAKISLRPALVPPADEAAWRQAASIVTGGPRLLRGGEIDINPARERVSVEFSETWHPRTALALLNDGKILLVTVDGRQPALSAGMPLEMLARLLLEFGAREGLNLDGGGSTTMVVQGKIVNSPSDRTGERPVSDAILLFPRR